MIALTVLSSIVGTAMGRTFSTVPYTYLKRGVYYFVRRIPSTTKYIFLMINITAFPNEGLAVELNLMCHQLHGENSFVTVKNPGSDEPSVEFKVSGGELQKAVSYGDKYEVSWYDGWGYNYEHVNGACAANFCPTEKRLRLSRHTDNGHIILFISQYFISECCIEKKQGSAWVPEIKQSGDVVNTSSRARRCLILDLVR